MLFGRTSVCASCTRGVGSFATLEHGFKEGVTEPQGCPRVKGHLSGESHVLQEWAGLTISATLSLVGNGPRQAWPQRRGGKGFQELGLGGGHPPCRWRPTGQRGHRESHMYVLSDSPAEVLANHQVRPPASGPSLQRPGRSRHILSTVLCPNSLPTESGNIKKKWSC